MKSLHRCRMAWKGLFLWDLATTDGAYTDPRYLRLPIDGSPAEPSYQFSEERPSASDWEACANFWGAVHRAGASAVAPLRGMDRADAQAVAMVL